MFDIAFVTLTFQLIFTFQWICLPIILLILVGVELPLRVVVTILECCVTFSGVKLSIRSFVLLLLLSEKDLTVSSLPGECTVFPVMKIWSIKVVDSCLDFCIVPL